MLRVVLDANQFVSSLLVKVGLPAQALDAWRAGAYQLIVSPAILQEVEHTLSYARIQRKYNVSPSNVQRLLTELANSALIFAGSAAPDDPDDEVVLACAIDGRADLIVTGDHHLLGLGEFRGIPIVPVRQLLERLADQDAARPNR
jgi:putative PIN family toxin of toxin-antitoxin system